MSSNADINRMILKKIEDCEVEQTIKQFIIDILKYEYSVTNRSNLRFTDEYKKLIQRYSRTSSREGD